MPNTYEWIVPKNHGYDVSWLFATLSRAGNNAYDVCSTLTDDEAALIESFAHKLLSLNV